MRPVMYTLFGFVLAHYAAAAGLFPHGLDLIDLIKGWAQL